MDRLLLSSDNETEIQNSDINGGGFLSHIYFLRDMGDDDFEQNFD